MAKRYGVTEEILLKVITNYEKTEEITPKQKVVLRFVDSFYENHSGSHGLGHVKESLWEGMREHFSEGEIVEIAWYAAFTMAHGKLIYAFQIPREDEV